MIIIETFERGSDPRAPPSSGSQAGPERYDRERHLTTSQSRRSFSLSAADRRRAPAADRNTRTVWRTEIARSSTATHRNMRGPGEPRSPVNMIIPTRRAHQCRHCGPGETVKSP
jgi:hypothetical protein